LPSITFYDPAFGLQLPTLPGAHWLALLFVWNGSQWHVRKLKLKHNLAITGRRGQQAANQNDWINYYKSFLPTIFVSSRYLEY
jgi:hypothetical protein